MEINSVGLTNLYNKSNKEDITPFVEGVGFSIVCPYLDTVKLSKEGQVMMIKVSIDNEGKVSGSINTVLEKQKGHYSIMEESGTQSFWFNKEEGFEFDSEKKSVLYKPKDKYLSISSLIEVIKYNHLRRRVLLRRKFAPIVEQGLKDLFWVSGKKYDHIELSLQQTSFHSKQESELEHANIEPFFKYFYISKNLIFTLLMLLLILYIEFLLLFDLSIDWSLYSVANPFVIAFIFFLLFSLEKLSVFIDSSIKNMFDKEKRNFMLRMFEFSRGTYNFKLKFPRNTFTENK